jgi:hypothetical protein
MDGTRFALYNTSGAGAHAYTALTKTPEPETQKAETSFQVEEEDHR